MNYVLLVTGGSWGGNTGLEMEIGDLMAFRSEPMAEEWPNWSQERRNRSQEGIGPPGRRGGRRKRRGSREGEREWK